MPFRLLASLLVLIGLGGCAAAAGSESRAGSVGVPRYRFIPGQKLTYRMNSSIRHWRADKASLIEQRHQTTLWVMSINADGSARMIVGEHLTRNKTTAAGNAQKLLDKGDFQSDSFPLYTADVFPDGHVASRRATDSGTIPAMLFPPLPQSAEQAKSSWEAASQLLRFVCKPASEAPDFVFDAAVHTPFDQTLLDSQTQHYAFDPARGLIRSAQSTYRREGTIKGAGTGSIELAAADTMSSDEFKQMSSESEVYLRAADAYDAALATAAKAAPADAELILSKCLADLQKAAAAVHQPDLKADSELLLGLHDQRARGAIAASQRSPIGKPAPDFETVDMDGSKLRLSDLRGKVVVLDFWFRGCGWCVASMPQMNQLVADYAGRPVSILGLNIDTDPDDARFIMRKMELKYSTLRAQGLPEKFGVDAYPAVIVIDQNGIIRDMRIGYDPELRKDLGDLIQKLLVTTKEQARS